MLAGSTLPLLCARSSSPAHPRSAGDRLNRDESLSVKNPPPAKASRIDPAHFRDVLFRVVIVPVAGQPRAGAPPDVSSCVPARPVLPHSASHPTHPS